MRIASGKEAMVVGAGMFGLVLLVGAAPSRTAPVASETCCNITSVDAAKQTVTVKTANGKHSFALKLADATSVKLLRSGTSVSFSNEELTLWAGTQAVKLQSITYVPVANPSGGAVASGATSGTARPPRWIRKGARSGRCPPSKQVATEEGMADCVLTHDRTAEGKGCEYFCV